MAQRKIYDPKGLEKLLLTGSDYAPMVGTVTGAVLGGVAGGLAGGGLSAGTAAIPGALAGATAGAGIGGGLGQAASLAGDQYAADQQAKLDQEYNAATAAELQKENERLRKAAAKSAAIQLLSQFTG